MPNAVPENRQIIAELKSVIKGKWPGAIPGRNRDIANRPINAPTFANLIPDGIPRGQLLEICGDASSGKTSFLFKFLSELGTTSRVVYFDFPGCFLPAAAACSGNDISRFLVVHPETLPNAVRAAEFLLDRELADFLVFDLIGETEKLPQILLHRLRRQTVRRGTLTVFLTDSEFSLIPPSMVSIRLKTKRIDSSRIEVMVERSRICAEGIVKEVDFDEL
jgi:hypothetical protein